MFRSIFEADNTLILGCLAVLGMLLAAGFHEQKKLSGFSLVAKAVLFGAIFAISGQILLLMPKGGAKGEAGPDLISLLGLIVTVITGVTVVLAFRALDDAKKAQDAVRDARNVLDNRISLTNLSLLRLEAYVEAEDRLRQAQQVPNMRRLQLLRVELVPVFIAGDVAAVLSKVKPFVSRPEILWEIGPAGRRFFEALESDPTLSGTNRKTLRRIMHHLD
jgi:hypothetical protein